MVSTIKALSLSIQSSLVVVVVVLFLGVLLGGVGPLLDPAKHNIVPHDAVLRLQHLNIRS